MTHLTQDRLNKLDALYVNGQLEGISNAELKSLSMVEIEVLIRECEKIPPQTYQPLTDIMRNELISQIRSGNLKQVSEEDLKYMTEHTASALLWIVASPGRNLERLATRAQRKRVKKLIAEGFLQGGNARQFRNLSCRTADRLIEEGERNALNGVRVKHSSQP